MKHLKIYDKGFETFDRFTIVNMESKHIEPEFGLTVYYCIAASEHGSGFFIHCECTDGDHLGKQVQFEDLTEELQQMIKADQEL